MSYPNASKYLLFFTALTLAACVQTNSQATYSGNVALAQAVADNAKVNRAKIGQELSPGVVAKRIETTPTSIRFFYGVNSVAIQDVNAGSHSPIGQKLGPQLAAGYCAEPLNRRIIDLGGTIVSTMLDRNNVVFYEHTLDRC